ncbi:MAG: hypothetical protein V7646_391 [Pseudonocardia sp.]
MRPDPRRCLDPGVSRRGVRIERCRGRRCDHGLRQQSHPTLVRDAGRPVQDLLLQLQLRDTTTHHRQLGPFFPADRGRPLAALLPQLLDPIAQDLVVHPELAGHIPKRTATVQGQLLRVVAGLLRVLTSTPHRASSSTATANLEVFGQRRSLLYPPGQCPGGSNVCCDVVPSGPVPCALASAGCCRQRLRCGGRSADGCGVNGFQ